MSPIVKNILAVLLGLVIGSIVNMGLIMISGSVLPPPAGVDNTTMEGLEASIHLFEPKHYLFPFLAHALGTLVGAMVALAICASHHKAFAYGVAGFFFLGGLMNVILLPAPLWFEAVDLILAYFPMAYIALRIFKK